MTIILIGPMKVGKSTVARLLAAKLGIPRHAMDKNRWTYYNEIGYDAEHARHLAETESLEAAARYCKPFEVHAVERHLTGIHDCIVDFGAGYTVQDDPLLFQRVQQALAPHANTILLLPSPLPDQSINFLAPRNGPDLYDLNAHYIRHPANRRLAKAIIYTMDKTPEETCAEILQTLGINRQSDLKAQ